MIFLLNPERVLTEVAEVARCHIAELTSVSPDRVDFRLEFDPSGKRVVPSISVAPDGDPTALEMQMIQGAIRDVWLGWAKQALVERLNGLAVRRDGAEEA